MGAAGPTWTTSDVVGPRIRAEIKTDFWLMKPETSQMYSSLSVLESSLHILFCIARYPVRWYNAEGSVVSNLKTVCTVKFNYKITNL